MNNKSITEIRNNLTEADNELIEKVKSGSILLQDNPNISLDVLNVLWSDLIRMHSNFFYYNQFLSSDFNSIVGNEYGGENFAISFTDKVNSIQQRMLSKDYVDYYTVDTFDNVIRPSLQQAKAEFRQECLSGLVKARTNMLLLPEIKSIILPKNNKDLVENYEKSWKWLSVIKENTDDDYIKEIIDFEKIESLALNEVSLAKNINPQFPDFNKESFQFYHDLWEMEVEGIVRFDRLGHRVAGTQNIFKLMDEKIRLINYAWNTNNYFKRLIFVQLKIAYKAAIVEKRMYKRREDIRVQEINFLEKIDKNFVLTEGVEKEIDKKCESVTVHQNKVNNDSIEQFSSVVEATKKIKEIMCPNIEVKDVKDVILIKKQAEDMFVSKVNGKVLLTMKWAEGQESYPGSLIAFTLTEEEYSKVPKTYAEANSYFEGKPGANFHNINEWVRELSSPIGQEYLLGMKKECLDVVFE